MEESLQIAGEEPFGWVITLAGGAKMFLRAHCYSEQGSWYVFSNLMSGDPDYLMEVARVPTDVVVKILSE